MPAWWVGLAYASLIFAYRLKDFIGWIGAFTFLWTVMSSLTVITPLGLFGHVDPSLRSVVEKDALLALTSTLLLFLGVTATYGRHWKRLWAVFAGAMAALTIGQFIFHFEPEGFLHNNSINGCLLAILFPWTVGLSPLLGILVLIAVVLTHASMPWIVFAAVFLAAICRLRMIGWRSLVVIGLGFLVAGLYFVPEFTSFNGRLEVWGQVWRYWTSDLSSWGFWVGAGQGTAKTLLPLFQMDAGKSDAGGWFLWAHNDWLQLGLEQGLIGLLIWAAFAINVLYKARKDAGTFAAIVGWMVCAAGNYPARIWLFCLLGMVLVEQAITGDQT